MTSIARIALTAATALVAGYLAQPFRPVVVQGRSMLPTLQPWQVLAAIPNEGIPKKGEIVVFDLNGSTMVKRVEMVPGDSYTEVYLPYAKRWLPARTGKSLSMAKRRGFQMRKVFVPAGQIFVVGDNPEESLDSRAFGFVPIKAVRSIVLDA